MNKILNKKCPDQINKIHTLKQIRNIKKMNSDNELNKNLEYTSGEDPDKEIDNDFIYETDNSSDE